MILLFSEVSIVETKSLYCITKNGVISGIKRLISNLREKMSPVLISAPGSAIISIIVS
mgnify:CR=1 FL=1